MYKKYTFSHTTLLFVEQSCWFLLFWNQLSCYHATERCRFKVVACYFKEVTSRHCTQPFFFSCFVWVQSSSDAWKEHRILRKISGLSLSADPRELRGLIWRSAGGCKQQLHLQLVTRPLSSPADTLAFKFHNTSCQSLARWHLLCQHVGRWTRGGF